LEVCAEFNFKLQHIPVAWNELNVSHAFKIF